VAAFAAPAELASHLQVPTVDTATATLALDFATGLIRDECGGWSITQESNVAKTLDSYGMPSLWLPTRLLTAVASVVENGITLTHDTHYRWWGNGRLERLTTCWPTKPRSVVVTYTHGYTTVLDDVKGVCLALAGRRYQNPMGAKAQVAGPFSQSYASSEAGSLSDAEKEALEPYKLEYLA